MNVLKHKCAPYSFITLKIPALSIDPGLLYSAAAYPKQSSSEKRLGRLHTQSTSVEKEIYWR